MLSAESTQQLESCKAALGATEDTLSQYLAQCEKNEPSQITPLLQAEHWLLVAEAVNAIYQLHTRLGGTAVEDSKYLKDSERLKIYRKKINKVETQKWLKEHKRSLEINVSAANRFISQAIPDLTPAQRSQLHKAGQPGKKENDGQQIKLKKRSVIEEAAAFLDSIQRPAEDDSSAADEMRSNEERSRVMTMDDGMRSTWKGSRQPRVKDQENKGLEQASEDCPGSTA